MNVKNLDSKCNDYVAKMVDYNDPKYIEMLRELEIEERKYEVILYEPNIVDAWKVVYTTDVEALATRMALTIVDDTFEKNEAPEVQKSMYSMNYCYVAVRATSKTGYTIWETSRSLMNSKWWNDRAKKLASTY